MPHCNVIIYDDPVPYPIALALQKRIVTERQLGQVPDTLLLMEHPATITLGRSARSEDLFTPLDGLAARGIAIETVDRGGQITFHAPGQLVGYPIFDLREHGQDLHLFLRQIEEINMLVLQRLGLEPQRRAGFTGVWIDDRKIVAIGIKVTRWISMHGFAFNIAPDLIPFRKDFVPCGLTDFDVTSLAELIPEQIPTRSEIEELLVEAVRDVYKLTPRLLSGMV